MKKSSMRWVLGGYLLSLLLIPRILLQNRSPTATLAWCWSILSFPFIGPLAYLVTGSDRLTRKRAPKRTDTRKESPIGNLQIEEEARESVDGLSEQDRIFISQVSTVNRYPTSTVNGARLLVDAERFYPALEEAIDAAEDHVHIQFFIFRPDKYGKRMLDALTRALNRGVEARLLVDYMGSPGLRRCHLRSYLRAGGEFGWFRTFRPLRGQTAVNLRNHRKIQVIDGRIGFIGGMNIGREYAGEDPKIGSWRDIQVRVEGNAVSWMQTSFLDDWEFATDRSLEGARYFPPKTAGGCVAQLMVDGPDILEDPIQLSIVAVLNEARERVWLTAGYFVPNEPLLSALKIAAARGVDVRLLVTEKGDHPYLVNIGRSYYEELLDYGVRIFEYSRGLNHAKVALCDRDWVMIGSANFDRRSMNLNFESNIMIRDTEVAAELERVLRNDYEQDSTEIQLDAFSKRPHHKRLLESILRPLAPMM